MTEAPVQSILTPLSNTVASIIAIMNNKGGAGKTSTITNLAMTLAQAGRRVLLIDGDQQANSTEVMANGKNTMRNMAIPSVTCITTRASIFLMPSFRPSAAKR